MRAGKDDCLALAASASKAKRSGAVSIYLCRRAMAHKLHYDCNTEAGMARKTSAADMELLLQALREHLHRSLFASVAELICALDVLIFLGPGHDHNG